MSTLGHDRFGKLEETPTDILEIRAAEQRMKLHESVSELREKVRDQFDMEAQARRHVWPASGVAAFLSMMLGYGVTALFRGARRKK